MQRAGPRTAYLGSLPTLDVYDPVGSWPRTSPVTLEQVLGEAFDLLAPECQIDPLWSLAVPAFVAVLISAGKTGYYTADPAQTAGTRHAARRHPATAFTGWPSRTFAHRRDRAAVPLG